MRILEIVLQALPLLIILFGGARTIERLATILERVERALDRISEKVDDHETRISRVEGARR